MIKPVHMIVIDNLRYILRIYLAFKVQSKLYKLYLCDIGIFILILELLLFKKTVMEGTLICIVNFLKEILFSENFHEGVKNIIYGVLPSAECRSFSLIFMLTY